eukprot:evm.model.scf_1066.5 EVM.evm.TU.scf_1066.5   scf_1066:40956-47435(+)
MSEAAMACGGGRSASRASRRAVRVHSCAVAIVLLIFGTLITEQPARGKGISVLLPVQRFPYHVILKGHGQEQMCNGIIIRERAILTTATCLESLGGRPIAMINTLDESYRGRTDVQGVSMAGWWWEEVWVDDWRLHPTWTGNRSVGVNAALLKLRRPVSVPWPTVADFGYPLLPNSRVHTIQPEGCEIRLSRHDVVDDVLCPGGDMDGMFCAYPCTGLHQGSAMLVLDEPPWTAPNFSLTMGSPELDLLVGVCPSCDSSFCSNSVLACVLVGHLRPWLDMLAAKEDWVPH